MSPLHRFWHALEDVHGHCATLLEWRQQLGPDFELVKAHRFLHPTDRFAESVSVSGNRCALPYRVVPLDQDRVEAISDDEGNPIVLAKADVLLYRIEFRAVCRALAEAFGFSAECSPMSKLPQTHLIGNYRPYAGYAFPAFLVCSSDASMLVQAAESLVARGPAPLLLAVPTSRMVSRDFIDLLSRHGATCLELTESVEVDRAGKLVQSTAGDRRITAFRDSVIPQASEDAPHVFFPTPPDARWCNLQVKLLDGETASIRLGPITKVLTYVQMGFVDRRNGRPDKQWELLREFARGYGHLTWDSPGSDRKNQARRDSLANGLKAFFRIDGEPIEYISSPSKGWKTVFSIE